MGSKPSNAGINIDCICGLEKIEREINIYNENYGNSTAKV